MSSPEKKIDYLTSNALNELFLRLPSEEIHQIAREVEAQCMKRGITYEDDDGSPRVIPLMLRPRIINPIQRSYFHYVCLEITDALKRLCSAYIADPQVRKLLPIGEEEERWLLEAWGRSVPRYQTIISRLDANTDFTAPDWRDNFQFFEANSVGVGGLYYSPVAEQIILEIVGPRLRRLDPELFLETNDDMRDLLLDQLLLHARSIGRQRCNIAVLDDPENRGGITEYPHLVAHFQARGHRAFCADPREMHLKQDELFFRDMPVDLVYRDMELKQCIEMERLHQVDMGPIKKAFQRNQVVSSLAGDFDHKSCWEVFTDDRFAHYFTPAQWSIFNRHILWTRLIRDTKTTDETGRMIDLLPHIQKNREFLVIKPNREYGGVGVTLGPEIPQGEWERVLEEAVKHPWKYVVQRFTPVQLKQFPVLHPDGSATAEEFYATCGFVVTAKDIGIVGRASHKRVVNIAQKGGLTTVLMILDQQRF